MKRDLGQYDTRGGREENERNGNLQPLDLGNYSRKKIE